MFSWFALPLIRLGLTGGSRPATIQRVDPEVLERFRQGDDAALKVVYEQFHGPVFAISMSIVRDRGLAADATQQTFVSAWRAADTYDPGQPLAPWIYAIARRKAIDIYRKRKRVVVSDELDTVSHSPGMVSTWEMFEVRAALDQLPDEEREIMRLSHLEGFTHAEIAEAIGIPIGTVKSRSHRAHQRLLELLDHLERG